MLWKLWKAIAWLVDSSTVHVVADLDSPIPTQMDDTALK